MDMRRQMLSLPTLTQCRLFGASGYQGRHQGVTRCVDKVLCLLLGTIAITHNWNVARSIPNRQQQIGSRLEGS